ncbi:glucan endo-1 3-beta-glucosidas [Striga asiatica]|uniref:glucan endo-1,3-beta-D-glucosidase n=1 Tax=Striga asiatica TaxID=4170 RepID=A0A5A7QRQ6_STRAF|nr:glucan endo-1 3-beta-glucosidas [Striga asiatica]
MFRLSLFIFFVLTANKQVFLAFSAKRNLLLFLGFRLLFLSQLLANGSKKVRAVSHSKADIANISSSSAVTHAVSHQVAVGGIGANWGSQSSHRLRPEIVVRMLRENGIQKVKLFDADYDTLRALAGSGIQVMVGIPNDMLSTLAGSSKAAERWVSQNVTHHLSRNVMIRYVAVGNEPFLETYNGSFLRTTFPALRNIQQALANAGHQTQVKVTVPLNADVYSSPSTGAPSGGDFRADIHDFILPIVRLLSDTQSPFTVNIYPFISLYTDPNFPVEYAFFDGTGATPVDDSGTSYYNMFDANHDTLVWALRRNGYANIPIIVGEIGWPTDGDRNANLEYARRFNQGVMARISSGRGTPMRPGPLDAYLFSLFDEDEKSIQPGNFERHWGIFRYDGQPKYELSLNGGGSGLVGARNVTYLEAKWCIMRPGARLDDARVAASVSYACGLADCTCLGYQTSCSGLDARGNISYAFNSYYQKNNQLDDACKFNGLGTVTRADPSVGNCRLINKKLWELDLAERSSSTEMARKAFCGNVTPIFCVCSRAQRLVNITYKLIQRLVMESLFRKKFSEATDSSLVSPMVIQDVTRTLENAMW